MPGAVAGIELPEGSPGAAEDAASGLRKASGGFERTGGITQRALTTVGSWQGMASMNFRDRCGDYGSAANAAGNACHRAAGALVKYGHRLEEARTRVKKLQEQAQECVDRIHAAEKRAADAGGRAQFAGQMAFQASITSAADGGAGAAGYRQQADDARAEEQAANDAAQRARDELDKLRQRARDERELVKEAGRVAAGLVDGAAGELPTVTAAAPPAAAPVKQEDKPWYEDAVDGVASGAKWTGGQLLGVGKGVGEGVVGIGEGGVMLYKLGLTNAMLDPGSFEQSWSDLGKSAQFAKDNPGEFGKALINWDDLSHGRYGEWAGNLAPDAALAFFTAGSGTVATRGVRGAKALEDVGDAARTADRLGDAAAGLKRGSAAAGASHVPGGLTDAGRAAIARGDDVVRHWTPLDGDRPLREAGRGDTFRSSTYDEVALSHDRVMYRDFSDPSRKLGAFYTREPSLGPTQSILDNALLPEWGNRATHSIAIRVPAGTHVFEGPTAAQGGLVGGGHQVVIPKVDPSWIVGR
jgi:hypothetical protein